MKDASKSALSGNWASVLRDVGLHATATLALLMAVFGADLLLRYVSFFSSPRVLNLYSQVASRLQYAVISAFVLFGGLELVFALYYSHLAKQSTVSRRAQSRISISLKRFVAATVGVAAVYALLHFATLSDSSPLEQALVYAAAFVLALEVVLLAVVTMRKRIVLLIGGRRAVVAQGVN